MNPSLPQIALSVRQPWAWLIVNGFKPIENRSRNIGAHHGPVLIHASVGMTMAEYEACQIFVSSISSLLAEEIPDPAELSRGGIVGMANVAFHCYGKMTSPWWTNSGYAYLLDNQSVLPFTPCKGRLGFFKVSHDILEQLQNEIRVHDRASKST